MTRSLINILRFFSLIIVFSSSLSHADTPAVFIIGDSLLDIGTNNFVIQAIAKAKYPHYGVDFFNSTPSGRFSNGLNMADYIAKVAFGESVTSPPSYLSLFYKGRYVEKRLAKAIDYNPPRRPISAFDPASMGSHENPSIGINFASAGTSILDINAAIDQAVPLREQINQLTSVHGNLTATIGPNKTRQLFERSAFFIGIGNNDVHFFALSRAKLNPDWYVGTLIQAYNATLKILYNLGARKFGIIAVPHVGCSPLMRVTILGGNCSKIANDLAMDFNTRLQHLLSNMTATSNQMSNGTATSNQMVYSIANSYDLLRDYYDNPKHYNFKNVNDACCGNGRFNAMTNCLPVANLCKNRDEYLFWDVSHPSEYTQRIMVEAFAFGGPQYVRPINWAKLVSL